MANRDERIACEDQMTSWAQDLLTRCPCYLATHLIHALHASNPSCWVLCLFQISSPVEYLTVIIICTCLPQPHSHHHPGGRHPSIHRPGRHCPVKPPSSCLRPTSHNPSSRRHPRHHHVNLLAPCRRVFSRVALARRLLCACHPGLRPDPHRGLGVSLRQSLHDRSSA